MNHSKLLMKSNGIHVYLFHSYSLSCNSISYVGSFNGTFRHWKIKLFQTLVNWVKRIETTPTPPNTIMIATTAYFCWLLNSLSFLFWHLILLLLISLLFTIIRSLHSPIYHLLWTLSLLAITFSSSTTIPNTLQLPCLLPSPLLFPFTFVTSNLFYC